MPARLSRSRAFWNLRAEQVMDQVFSQGEPTLKAVQVRIEPSAAQPQAEPVRQTILEANRQGLLWGAAGVALLGLVSSIWLGQNWQRSMQALNRERDLHLIERVRNIPLAANPQTNTVSTATPTAQTGPQPSTPPQEANAANPPLVPLTIPLAGPLAIADTGLSDADAAAATMPAEPLLVGVVHAGGGQGSAIFQLDQLSLSAAPGEPIGNSGWHLKTVQANGAVIEREGVQRSLSVGGAF